MLGGIIGVWRTVHPHAGGENVSVKRGIGPICGSPPRGWGKRSPIRWSAVSQSVHPHAGGENDALGNWYACFSVHPHAGGENCHVYNVAEAESGSPPRGWGKRDVDTMRRDVEAVHPHAGGENPSPKVVGVDVGGSPPRGWGKR